ncbi:DUF2683 family protein [Psychroflexus montanilacus]|uniref:DUF2683 family protein n=1 Tax=Psychroflexus montanilacus TaxID=2873598 RepID=UPI001CCB7F6D|nr:DUF2683 family protein [Psychroflexus montanilacus]MBZ9652790.1 hypothetical protein [Psychroflexus montanilacus]
MTTITLKINENSEKGKALLAFLKAFHVDKDKDDVQLVEDSKNPYNPEFVKKIEQAKKEVEDGETFLIETDSIWESIK